MNRRAGGLRNWPPNATPKPLPEERAEYQVFVEVGDLVAVLQAKARLYLSERPA